MIPPALRAAILGIVEGLTEFLPISSTGHLILTDAALGVRGEGAKAFEIVIQLGAVLAAVVYYRRTLWDLARGLVRGDAAARRLALNLFAAFLPAAVVGLLWHRTIKERLFGVGPVIAALAVGGVIMILVSFVRRRREASATADLAAIRLPQAIAVGLLQALSLWPGVSRSAAAIVGGQLAGLRTAVAADFAFLLMIPTLGAASLFDLVRTPLAEVGGAGPLAVGLVVSFLVGWAAVALLVRYLQTQGLSAMRLFGVYRIAIALIIAVVTRPAGSTSGLSPEGAARSNDRPTSVATNTTAAVPRSAQPRSFDCTAP